MNKEREDEILEGMGHQREEMTAYIDKQFDTVDRQFEGIGGYLGTIKSEINNVKIEISNVKIAVSINELYLKELIAEYRELVTLLMRRN